MKKPLGLDPIKLKWASLYLEHDGLSRLKDDDGFRPGTLVEDKRGVHAVPYVEFRSLPNHAGSSPCLENLTVGSVLIDVIGECVRIFLLVTTCSPLIPGYGGDRSGTRDRRSCCVIDHWCSSSTARGRTVRFGLRHLRPVFHTPNCDDKCPTTADPPGDWLSN